MCKHRNPIQNAPKPQFDNRMASMEMRLIDFLANMQRKQQIYGRCNEIILIQNSVPGLFSRLRVNIHTPERFLYRFQENDPA